jgi:hypothetical protein
VNEDQEKLCQIDSAIRKIKKLGKKRVMCYDIELDRLEFMRRYYISKLELDRLK